MNGWRHPVRRMPSCLLLTTVLAAVNSNAMAAAPGKPLPRPTMRALTAPFAVDLPLSVDGTPIGLLPVTVQGTRVLSFNANALRSLAADRITAETLAGIAAAADADGNADIAVLEALGVVLDYNSTAVALTLSLPDSLRTVESLSLRSGGGAAEGDRPSDALTGYANVRLAQAFVAESATGAARGTAAVFVDSALRPFGPAGGALEWSAGWLEDARKPFQRGEARYVIDDVGSAVRYSLGDIQYGAAEFQGAPALLGISMERQYGRLQPFRVVSATGQQSFTLPRASRIEVYVNGQFQNALSLRPGRYSLSDFAFLTGLNDVQIVVEDDTGQRQTLDFTLFLGADLLEPGLSVYSFNAGIQRELGADTIAYDSAAPAASGFVRYGIANWLTAGANWQGERGLQVYGLESVIGSPLGIFGLAGSRSRNAGVGSGWSGSLRWRYNFSLLSDRRNQEIEAATIWTDERFRALGLTALPPVFRSQSLLRLTTQLPGAAAVSLSARYARPHADTLPAERSAGVSLSKRFGRFTMNFRGDLVERDTRDWRGFVTVSLPLANRQSLNSSYDSTREESRVEWSRFGQDVVGDVSGRLQTAVNDAQVAISGDGIWRGNRTQLRGQYGASLPRDGGSRTQTGVVQLESGFAFADGVVAMGRPVSDAFAIIERHRTLSDTSVEVLGNGRDAIAVADGLGPALLANLDSYRDQRVAWNASEPPPGYDLGDTQRLVNPAFRSGYRYVAGSAASITVVAVALRADGTPIARSAAIVTALDRPEAPPQRTFTSKGGRFAVAQLAPGRYRIEFAERPRVAFTFTVDPDAVGLVDLGTLTAGATP